MLVAGRFDIYINVLSYINGFVAGHPEFKAIQPAGILEDVSMYPYLHKKHRELVPQLAAVLQAMKGDGTYQRLMQQGVRR